MTYNGVKIGIHNQLAMLLQQRDPDLGHGQPSTAHPDDPLRFIEESVLVEAFFEGGHAFADNTFAFHFDGLRDGRFICNSMSVIHNALFLPCEDMHFSSKHPLFPPSTCNMTKWKCYAV